MENMSQGSLYVDDELVAKAIARLAEADPDVAAANDKSWADALPDEAMVKAATVADFDPVLHAEKLERTISDAKARVQKIVEAAGPYALKDKATENAIKGFQDYIDGLSHAEKLEAVGLDVSKYVALPETDEFQDYKDRLVLELMMQMLQTASNIAVDKGLTVRQAKKLVVSVLDDVAEKLTA